MDKKKGKKGQKGNQALAADGSEDQQQLEMQQDKVGASQKQFYEDVNLSEDEAKMEIEVEERRQIEDAMKPLAADLLGDEDDEDDLEAEDSVSGSSKSEQEQEEDKS